MIKINKKNNKWPCGFTLVEVLLYLSIISIILLSVSYFFSMMLESRVKNQTILEVEQSGIQVMQVMQQAIRNAANVNAPLAGTSSTSCSLEVAEAAKNPVIFQELSGMLSIKEGTSPEVGLISSNLVASNVSFNNISRTGTPGIIRIQFTLSYKNNTGRNEYNYSRNFYGSASLR